MKNLIGSETIKLKDYFVKVNNISEDKEAYLRELIHEVMFYETASFIKSLRSNQIMCLEDIVEIFGFKYQFVRKNIVNQPMFSRLCFDDNVKKMISFFKDAEPGTLVKTDELAEEHLQKPHINFKLTVGDIENCKTIISKKIVFYRSSFMIFLKNQFSLYVDQKEHSLNTHDSDEIIDLVLNSKWLSGKELKDQLDFKHDVQLYRFLKSNDEYLKLIYNAANTKKPVTRYTKY